jgi:DNA-binding SARP family transcriptional activator
MPETARMPAEPAQAWLTDQPEPMAAPDQAPTLTAHLLGTFRVSVNDQPAGNWPSGRGKALFKYLLIHHDQPVLREVLMDVFWPDANPEAVRNRLNVALYGLRQELRCLTDRPVVIFEDGAYRLAPDWCLWLDVDEFSRFVEKGGRLESAGLIARAAAEYESAISLYQGDLLADDPYDDWPVLAREHLRVAYLDTLDRLSRIYFDQGQYTACQVLCQLILARDSCREDAHRQLMCCYSRQGQPNLALRQYQTCVEALRHELDVEPATATRQLADRIRRRKL